MVPGVQQGDKLHSPTRRVINPVARHGMNMKQRVARDLYQIRGLGQPLRAISKHPHLLAWLLGYICFTLAVTASILGFVGRLDLFGEFALVSAFVSASAFAVKLERYRRRDLVRERQSRRHEDEPHHSAGTSER